MPPQRLRTLVLEQSKMVAARRARNLPESTPHVTAPCPTTQSSTALLTCVIVWGREVLHGVVNRRRIDGKDGVAGSIPAGGSPRKPQLRPGTIPRLSRDQQLPTAFAREFARLSCAFGAGVHRLPRPLQDVPGACWSGAQLRPGPQSLDPVCRGVAARLVPSRSGGVRGYCRSERLWRALRVAASR
jgi:hypothetical protein